MEGGVVAFLLAGLQIALLNIVLSGDNVGVIALAIRNISDPKQAKKASMIGISFAIVLRIVFASIITLIMTIEWLPIRLVGGLLLLKITWDLINMCDEGDAECHVKSSNTFWKAVLSIIIADISMSLDNVLAIGGAANGNIGLIAFGVLLNIPILFFGSQFVANLMNKYKITIFIGGAILVHTALSMIIEDKLIAHYFNHFVAVAVPWTVAMLTLVYGCIKTGILKIPGSAVEIAETETSATKAEES